MNKIDWQCKFFVELSNVELYKILQLRAEVFVVEQNCAYQDLDSKDINAYHLFGCKSQQMVSYTRLLAPGTSYPNAASIGRVVTSKNVRGQNVGRELMRRSIDQTYSLFGQVAIKISAQLYLKKFYESFGFVQQSDVYLEDFIEHICMKKVFDGRDFLKV